MSEQVLAGIYLRTSGGDGELGSPVNGLSINQRKLLQWCDGKLGMSALVERLAAGHTVDSGKLVKDVERLLSLGLLTQMAVEARPLTGAKPQSGSFKKPVLLVGVVAGMAVGGWALLRTPESAVLPAAVQVDGSSVTGEVQAPAENKVLGVMPNPARWFSPANKQAPLPLMTPATEPKVAVKPELKPEIKVPEIKQTKHEAAVVSPLASQAAAAKSVAQAVAVEPISRPVPVVQASVTPPVVKPEVAAPNRKPLYREAPEFPSEALRQGVEAGTVKARITVGENGQVTKVDILEARPRRVFDRAVLASLAKWKFAPGNSGFTVDTEVEFKEN